MLDFNNILLYDVKFSTWLTEHGESINACDVNGDTPLIFSTRKSLSPTIVGELLKLGADIHVRDRFGKTPLMLALDNGDFSNQNAELLVKAYEDIGETPVIDSACEHGRFALLLAVFTNDGEAVRELLADGVDPNGVNEEGRTPLMLACQLGNTEMASILLMNGADVHARMAVNDNLTPIHFAASENHSECVRLLLDHGAQADERDAQMNTPLLTTAWGFPDPATIRVLLEHGADVHAENASGQSALEVASFYGNEESIRTLLRWGAGSNLKHLSAAFEAAFFENNMDKAPIYLEAGLPLGLSEAIMLKNWEQIHKLVTSGVTQNDLDYTLAKAVRYSSKEAVVFLLDQGATPNTALKKISYEWHFPVSNINLLFEAGGDINTTNEDGETVFTSMIGKRQSEERWMARIQMWLPYGVDVNAQTVAGKTMLMEAANLGYTAFARLLIDQGADVNLHDKEGGTALTAALAQGHTEIIQILLV